MPSTSPDNASPNQSSSYRIPGLQTEAPSQSDPFADNRGGGVLVKIAALMVILAIGYWGYERYREHEAQKEEAELSQLVAQLNRRNDQRIGRAIADRRITLGMTRYQAELARGKPGIIQRGQNVPDDIRKEGVVEFWIYSLGGDTVAWAAFDLSGSVIHSSDDLAIGKKP